MKKTVVMVGILVLMAGLLLSCGNGREEAVKQQKDTYVSQVEARLSGFDAKMTEFEKRGDSILPERKDEYNKTVDALKQKRDAVAKSLDGVKNASGAQWESAKAQTDAALQDLENSLNQAMSTFA